MRPCCYLSSYAGSPAAWAWRCHVLGSTGTSDFYWNRVETWNLVAYYADLEPVSGEYGACKANGRGMIVVLNNRMALTLRAKWRLSVLRVLGKSDAIIQKSQPTTTG